MKWILAAFHCGVLATVVVGGAEAAHEILRQEYLRQRLYGLCANLASEEIARLAPTYLGIAIAGGILLYGLLRLVPALRGRKLPRSVELGRWSLSVLGWSAVALWLGLTLATMGRPDGPNVLLILVDTLRADHLGCYGYQRDTSPHLDRLADDGVLFENAYSNSPWTKASVGTLLTGLYPATHRAVGVAQALAPRLTTAFELFANRGYRTLFLNGGNPFISDKSAFGQGSDTRRYHGYTDRKRASFEESTPLVVADALELLTASPKGRFFAYIHLMDPHLPYSLNAHNYRYTKPQDGIYHPGAFTMPDARGKELSEAQKRHIVGLYDGQINYVDEQIGRIVDALRDSGQLAETLVVVTSDHGEEFWDHDSFEHGHTVYRELLHVPLIMTGPGLAPRRVATRVQHLDLLATLLDLNRLEPGGVHLAGKSYAPLLRGRKWEPSPLFASSTIYGREKLALVEGGFKIIHNTHQRERWRLDGPHSNAPYELYDVTTDPGEHRDVVEDEPELLERMKRRLEKARRKARHEP